MAYAVIADMVTRFNATELIKCTDRTNAGTRNDTVLQAALDDAFGRMNGILALRYAMPIVGTASGEMLGYQCDIAHWLLYIGDKPDAVEERYKEAMIWLNNIAAGKLALGMVPAPTVIGSSVTQPCTTANAPNRFFTQDRLTDW